MKVLIVDDVPENLYILNSLLKSKGFGIVEAINGEDALQKAGLTKPDVIISDILMPVMDGFNLCHKWKSDPVLNTIPFIFYTATYTDKLDRQLALEMGADAFLIKPASFRELLDTISRVTGLQCKQPTKEPEENYYQKYNFRLVNKLEHKLSELELANQELQKKEAELVELNRSLDKSVAEKTLELIRSRQESQALSYSISHDLRAPLRSIDGYSSALLDDCAGELSQTGIQYLERIRHNTSQMADMIDGLLLLSKVTNSEFYKEPVNLSQISMEVVSQLCREQPERKIKFDISPDLTVEGDRRLIHLMMEKLIGNAWKYTTPAKEAEISIQKTDTHDKTVYYIKDNGIGFDPRYTSKLFDAFQKGHRSREFDGTGIGLTTAQRIARRHGGDIWAESQKGKGATFFFSLNTDISKAELPANVASSSSRS